MTDIFISYARSTEGQAKQIAEALRGLGYGVWRDDEIPANRAYADVIAERLATAKAVVVVWSAEAAKSEWVRSEAERARADHKLVQLSVDGARLPMPFDQTQCADLSGWSGGEDTPGWKQVVGAIANLASSSQPRGLDPRRAARKLSICVLPFVNMSGDPEQEYFSDGISEDIITDLSKVSALEVCARNTAFTFKGKSVKVPDVARELGVSHVLEGSVRKAGARVRITAQLIDGATGNHLWAERYDQDPHRGLRPAEDEISEAIVKALKLKLLPEEKKAIEQPSWHRTMSTPTISSSWPGQSWLDRQRRRSTYSRRRSSALCRRAVDLDPGYALAWAQMAAGQYNLHRDHGRAGDGGQAALNRALALDYNLTEARSLKALMLFHAGRHEEAAAEIAIALRLDPESYEVNYRAGSISYSRGRIEDAAHHFEKAAALIETDLTAPFMLISCYTALGDGENPPARPPGSRWQGPRKPSPRIAAMRGMPWAWRVQALAALGGSSETGLDEPCPADRSRQHADG